MMPLENQVCSLELSKRLKELGVKQDSCFWWSQNEVCYSQPSKAYNGEYWSAFTVAELGEMLPIIIQVTDRYDFIFTGRLTIERLSEKWWVYYFNNLDRRIEFDDIKEADARAFMVIYLIEQGLLNVADISKHT